MGSLVRQHTPDDVLVRFREGRRSLDEPPFPSNGLPNVTGENHLGSCTCSELEVRWLGHKLGPEVLQQPKQQDMCSAETEEVERTAQADMVSTQAPRVGPRGLPTPLRNQGTPDFQRAHLK